MKDFTSFAGNFAVDRNFSCFIFIPYVWPNANSYYLRVTFVIAVACSFFKFFIYLYISFVPIWSYPKIFFIDSSTLPMGTSCLQGQKHKRIPFHIFAWRREPKISTQVHVIDGDKRLDLILFLLTKVPCFGLKVCCN